MMDATPTVDASASEESSADNGDSERTVHGSMSVDGAARGILLHR